MSANNSYGKLQLRIYYCCQSLMTEVILVMSFRARSRSGFSLPELLVVMGIITVLGSVSYAALTAAWHSVNLSVDTQNLHQIGIALESYANDNDDRYPQGWDATSNQTFAGLLHPYTDVNLAARQNLFVSPATLPITATDGLPFNITYGINGELGLGDGAPTRSSVVNPTLVILVANSVQDPGNFERSSCTIYQPAGIYSPISANNTSDPIPVSTAVGNLDYPNGGKVNCLFVDGHVAPIQKGQVTWGNLVPR
jgi:prepilin-type N-terminal cleavage/methylation domain-containing protein/prepilin-type processing-associated H-X9-DG protein